MKLAYLISRYPLISHVFIQREVLALRRAGASIDTFTVRRAGPDHLLSADDCSEEARTHALVPPAPGKLARAHLLALATRPARYLATLALAIRLRGLGLRALLWQVFYFGEAVLMWHECRRRKIDHIHAHHANVASDVALLAARLGGRRWSWSFTMHGSTEFFDVREHRLPQKVELAGFVICVSDHGRAQLMSLVDTSHWDKLHVVHCGVDLGAFTPQRLPAKAGPLEILTVGRTVPVKGQTLLVEALAKLGERGVDARLTIVGDGPGSGPLRGLSARLGVGERLRLAGAVGQEQIRSYYEEADVFALPSFAEGVPVVLMEALAMEVPVVASRITGIPELVDDGVSGLLFVPGRGGELVDALEQILTASPERRAQMGRAGREKVRVEFDIDATALQLTDVFAEMVPRAKPSARNALPRGGSGERNPIRWPPWT